MLAVSGEPVVREPRLIHAKKALDGAYASAGLLLICCRPIIAETHYKNLMRVAHHREPQAGLQFVGMDRAKEGLNNTIFAASRGRGGLDLKFDDIADKPGLLLSRDQGANGRYARRSASFPAVTPAPGRLLPSHPVAWRPAISRFENPSNNAMRCLFFATPR